MKRLLFIFAINVFALSCSAQAGSQQEIKNDQLDSIVALINLEFNTQEEFLLKFKTSQSNWEKSTLSDLDMQFPIENKEVYGSAYTACRKALLNAKIKRRIAFLQQWTDGVLEGDVCSGSMPITKDTISIRDRELNKILEQDTIVFDENYSLQDFVKLIDIKRGVLKLRELPSGKNAHYNPIASNRFQNKTEDIPSGNYALEIRYGFESRDNKIIKKTIRIHNKAIKTKATDTKRM